MKYLSGEGVTTFWNKCKDTFITSSEFNKNKLSQKNVLYNVSNMPNIEPALVNLFTNASFYVWPMGQSTSISATQDKYVCGNWRVKTTDNASCIASKLNEINGYINLSCTFGSAIGYVYLRQLIPVVTQLSGKTYTFSAEVEVNANCDCDLYIQARKNTDDATRVLVVDSENLTLSAGRHKIACTFTVPDISGMLSTVDIKNSLEAALRFNGTNKTVNVKVYECVIVEGEVVKTNSATNPAKDFGDVELFYEVGSGQVSGYNTISGQKRLLVPFKTKKIQLPIITIISDLVGNVGKVSTYDIAGVRSDNVPYTALSYTEDYIMIIINECTAAGIAFKYVVDCYF